MEARRYALPALFTLALSASLAIGMAVQAPTTWVVDDSGGPGVDFTAIQPAINAAGTGDLILIKEGFYGNFDLSKSLTMLGEVGVQTTSGSIHDVAGMAAVAEIEFKALGVFDCTGTVVLDRLWGWTTSSNVPPTLAIRDCQDVRVIEIDAVVEGPNQKGMVPRVYVDGSRVEITSSTLGGGQGSNTSTGYAGDGDSALTVDEGCYVHLSRSSLRAGDGGSLTVLGGTGYAGNGGSALNIIDGDVLITGRGAEVIRGGRGGGVVLYGYAGDGGDGIEVSSTSSVRYSRTQLIAGKGGNDYVGGGSSGAQISVAPGGKKKKPKLADPVLERLGDPLAGAPIALKLRSKPGTYSRLFWGFTPIVQSSPGVLVDKLLVKQGTIPMGFVPPSGVLNSSFAIAPSVTPGTVIYLQAMSIFPSGKIRRTNSVPMVVR